MPVIEVSDLERDARAIVDKVADDPLGRVQLRRDFYRKFGFAHHLDIPTEFGFGTSEIAFLLWEVERGVLNPLTGTTTPGSAWWRNVNLEFIYYSELAALAIARGVEPSTLPAPARAWIEYIAKPSPRSWYRAHNTSIVAGYLGRLDDALAEQRPEQVFMNVVLYRVLYAQGLVEGIEMGRLGKLLADPDLPSVDIMVHLPDFYPRHYPLSAEDLRDVMHKGHSLEELAVILLDDVFIIPHLTPLYKHAAEWSGRPELLTYLIRGEPVYPTRDPRPWHQLLLRRVIVFLLILWQKLARK
jgi:hypothetical protein